ITAKQLEKLSACCTRAEQAVKSDADKVGELNRKFHELLIEASGNERLKAMIFNLRSAMQPYRALTLHSDRFRDQSVRDHRHILELLQRGETEELARLMDNHLRVAQEATLQGIEAQADRIARAI